MKKVILYAVLVILLISGIWVYKLVWGKPFNFDHLAERYLLSMVRSQPEILTLVGAINNTALDFHSDKLSDASPNQAYRNNENDRRYHSILQRYDRDKLEGQQVVTYDMMNWLLSKSIEGEAWQFHSFPVNQTAGAQSDFPSFMDTYHEVIHAKSARNYVSRLEAVLTKFDQVRETVMLSAQKGVYPPKFTIELVLKEMNDFIDTPAEENIIYTSFVRKIDEVEDMNDEIRDGFKNEVLEKMDSHVYPAYELLIATFKELQASAREESGAWTLPDGDAYYRYMTRYHTSLNIEPEEVHDIGLSEVDRISQEMFTLFDQIGITNGTVAERFKELDTRPGTFYPDEHESYDAIIAEYMRMTNVLYEGTAPLFNRLPKADVEVRRVPLHSQESAPFAYYSIPALDGSRPGIFFINLRNLEEVTSYGMMTLTAHEAVPGHHFQLALAQEIEGVPTIRRLYPFTSYAEGWALYSEALVAEIGMYDDDPTSDLGRLQAEMFRAVRLVVDTGIHLKRWSRAEAVAYMYENTGMPMTDIISEIDRYVVWPGQALAYKIGMIHIQKLREKAETQLGDAFDIAEFHDVVLMNGSLPLEVLTMVVDNYINEKS